MKTTHSMDSQEFKNNPFENAPFEVESKYKYAVVYDQRETVNKKSPSYGQVDYYETSKEANERAKELPKISNRFYFNVGIRKRLKK